jgi:hypothetical protein
MADDQDFVLRLRPLPSETPSVIRLRHVLKQLLRQYRFRCLEVSGVPAAAPGVASDGRSTAGVESGPAESCVEGLSEL